MRSAASTLYIFEKHFLRSITCFNAMALSKIIRRLSIGNSFTFEYFLSELKLIFVLVFFGVGSKSSRTVGLKNLLAYVLLIVEQCLSCII